MKAAIRSIYGPPDVLSIQDIAIPIPKDDEVLVKVYATTVNRSDCGVLRGKPFLVKFFTGFFKPRHATTGTDFAGQIEAIGKNVQSFKIGEKVMGFAGMGLCSHAQYLVHSETKGILTMPTNINYEQAAACMEGTFYAAHAVNELKPGAGQKALVNGATGAIGSSLVQVLKYYGVNVTAVCAGEYRELLKSLGANKVIDYKTEYFMKTDEQYDYIFDTVGNTNFSRCKRLLTTKGIFLPSDGLHNLLLAKITSLFGGKKVMFPLPGKLREGLNFVKMLVEKGNFRPVIDRKYTLDQIAEAYRYVEIGHKTGNVIITMNGI